MALVDSDKFSKLTVDQLLLLHKGKLEEALRDPQIAGCFTGRLGPYIIRHKDGKPIVSRRAERFRASQSAAAVYHRNRFAAVQKFAAFVNTIPLISRIWKSAALEGYLSYHRIIKYNVKTCGQFHPTEKNIITPQPANFNIQNADLQDNLLTLTMDQSFISREADELKVIRLLYDPVDPKDQAFRVDEIFVKAYYPQFYLEPSTRQSTLSARYKSCLYYIALIRDTGTELNWSNTIAVESKVTVN